MPQNEKSYTVSQLNAALKMYLKDFSKEGIWIKGEILGYKEDQNRRYASFLLCEKEDGSDEVVAQVQAMCWGTELSEVRYKLKSVDRSLEMKDGIFCRLKCAVDFWPKAGRLQVIVKDIDPSVTIGELHMLRMKVFNEIKALGLHEKNGSLELSVCPLKIAMISSKGGAGYHDFLSEIKNSGFPFMVDFYHAAVQGADTEKEVSAAIERISKNADKYDVVVLIRGGGSTADLKWFDNKKICLAIAKCPVPVLTGIGHEINLSAADMVSSMSFKTPTAAAAFLVDRVGAFQESLNSIISDIHSKAGDIIADSGRSLKEAIKDIISDAQLVLEKEKISLKAISDNIKREAPALLKSSVRSIMSFEEKAGIYDPFRTLRLGYSITRDKKGAVIKKTSQAALGTELVTQLSDGKIFSQVKEKEGL